MADTKAPKSPEMGSVWMKDPAGNLVEVAVPAKTVAQVKNVQEKANATKYDAGRVEIAKEIHKAIQEILEDEDFDVAAVVGQTILFDFDRGAAPKILATNLIPDLRERPRVDDGFTWSKPKPKVKK